MNQMQPVTQNNLRPRVLIVEDEIIVSLFLEDVVSDLGFEVAGVVSRLEEGLDRIQTPDFSLAVLDVHLNGQEVFPLADRLAEMGLPFVFATGYGARGIPPRHSGRPVLQKPFGPDELFRAISPLAGRDAPSL